MKDGKFVLIGWAFLAATILWTSPVSALEQDTGYPWFGDIIEEKAQVVPDSNTTFRLDPIKPPEQDTGYPWFADTMESDLIIMKPIEVFGSHPRTVEEDSGYPWHSDTQIDNPNDSKSRTMTR